MTRLEELVQRQIELMDQICAGKSPYLDDDANCSKAKQELMAVNLQIQGEPDES
jgi:hypothetical protein